MFAVVRTTGEIKTICKYIKNVDMFQQICQDIIGNEIKYTLVTDAFKPTISGIYMLITKTKITMVTATVSVGYVWNDANVVCTDEFELIEDKSTRNDR